MKAIIASDIHGNIVYTEKLEQLILRENPELLILLGDYFSSDSRVLDILNKYSDIICAVKGNCDYYYDSDECNFDYNHDYLILKLDGIEFFCTHGDQLYKKELLELSKDKYILQGHTHVYSIHGNKINPGSVGRPRENPEHTCILYNNKTLYLVDLDNLENIDKRIL